MHKNMEKGDGPQFCLLQGRDDGRANLAIEETSLETDGEMGRLDQITQDLKSLQANFTLH